MQHKTNTANKTKTFNEALAKAIDETFNQIFQQEGASAINQFLKICGKIELTQVADSPDQFSKNLHKIMSSATHVVEQPILRKLYMTFGIKFENKNGFSFSEHIIELKKTLNV